jgi:hypothetical protein
MKYPAIANQVNKVADIDSFLGKSIRVLPKKRESKYPNTVVSSQYLICAKPGK